MPEKDNKDLYGRVEPAPSILPAERWQTHRARNPDVSKLIRKKRRSRKLVRWGLIAVASAAIAFPAYSMFGTIKRWRASERQAVNRAAAQLEVERKLAIARAGETAVEKLIASSNEGDNLIQEVLPMLDRRLFVEANRKITAQLEKTPDRIDLQLVQASLFMQSEQWTEARDLLVRILHADPDDSSARRMLAQACQELGKFEEAFRLAVWILDRNPSNADGLRIAARASLSAGEYMRAMPHIRRLVEKYPDDPTARQYLAVAYLRLGQYSRAVEKFSDLIEANPGVAENHYNLAVCHAQQGHAEDTVEVLHRAQASVPSSTIRAWLGEKDFSQVLQDPILKVYMAELGATAPLIIASQVKTDAGVGLLPQAPRIELRAIDFRK